MSGKADEAKALLSNLEKASADQYVSPYDFALVHKALGLNDECFQWLDRAYEIRDGWMIYITVDPRWKSVRALPEFVKIVERVGLPM